jgi:hypothetical protein
MKFDKMLKIFIFNNSKNLKILNYNLEKLYNKGKDI